VPRRVRKRGVAPGLPLSPMEEPNQVWCADFKGWFLTGDGKRCHPFTLLDGNTRFLLRCQAVERCDCATVKPILEAAFREFGLPDALQSDNGPPFASQAPAGLSQLAVWLIHLDVWPQRIEPGKPQQNGRQERFHRTLKADTANPPQADRAAQQRSFKQFRREYNEERPHEALDQEPPASRYYPSDRAYPRKIRSPIYPDHWKVRRVRRTACIYWENGLLPVNQFMVGEQVGLAPLGDPEDRYWQLYYRKYPMMVLDTHYMVWIPGKEADRLLKQYPVEEDWCW
jgi:putative transposase